MPIGFWICQVSSLHLKKELQHSNLEKIKQDNSVMLMMSYLHHFFPLYKPNISKTTPRKRQAGCYHPQLIDEETRVQIIQVKLTKLPYNKI